MALSAAAEGPCGLGAVIRKHRGVRPDADGKEGVSEKSEEFSEITELSPPVQATV
jgi:hypothetical protein